MASMWPTMTDYQEAVQAPKICFDDKDLKVATTTLNKLGLPRPICGQFASVYELENGSERWAIKCFLRNIPDLHSRYAKISKHLDTLAHMPYFMTFHYIQKGIRVRGQLYPLVKMEWVEGLPLNVYAEACLNSPADLVALEEKWLQLLEDLHAAKVAHADLQHGNVVVGDDNELKLIDYDGMWVPKLKGQKTHETGHPDYQTPLRGEKDFHADIDEFAGDVIFIAIRALQKRPDLWQKYNNGDNMLFRRKNFLDPEHVELFDELRALGDNEIDERLASIISHCGGKGKKGKVSRFFKPRKPKADPPDTPSGSVVKAAQSPTVTKPVAPAPAPPPPKPAPVAAKPPPPPPPKPQAPAPVAPAPAPPASSGPSSWLTDHTGSGGGGFSAPSPVAAPVKTAHVPAPAKASPKVIKAAPAPAPAPAPAAVAPAVQAKPAKPARPAPAAAASGPDIPFGRRLLGYTRLLLHVMIMTPVMTVMILELLVVREGNADHANAILMIGFGLATFMGLLSSMSLFTARAIHKVTSTLFFGLTAFMVLLNISAVMIIEGWTEWNGNDPLECGLMLGMLGGSAAALGIEAICRRKGIISVFRFPWSAG